MEPDRALQAVDRPAGPDEVIVASVWVLLLYDVCEEIDFGSLRDVLGETSFPREAAFPYPTPEYVRFERPPITQHLPPRRTADDQPIRVTVGYYDYGAIGVQLEFPFSGTWNRLVHLIARSIEVLEFKTIADAILRDRIDHIRSALVGVYPQFLDEDYCVVHIEPRLQPDGTLLPAERLIREHGEQIAQIVRADATELSASELKDALDGSMSYSPLDVVVAGWNTALVYDTVDGFAPVLQLIEYANSQLLEFRRYDEVLTGVLQHVYRTLETGTGIWHRWRLAREAARLNTIRLDVHELTERIDNSIKFFGEMFSARLYRLVAAKVGVPDYRRLVDDKLRTAHEQYLFMVEQFHQSRAFVLELTIVIILFIDLYFLFRGKS